jgi:hypothetical protein
MEVPRLDEALRQRGRSGLIADFLLAGRNAVESQQQIDLFEFGYFNRP